MVLPVCSHVASANASSVPLLVRTVLASIKCLHGAQDSSECTLRFPDLPLTMTIAEFLVPNFSGILTMVVGILNKLFNNLVIHECLDIFSPGGRWLILKKKS